MLPGVRHCSRVSAMTKQLKKPAVQLVRDTESLNKVSYNTALRIAGCLCTLHSVCMSVCPLYLYACICYVQCVAQNGLVD